MKNLVLSIAAIAISGCGYILDPANTEQSAELVSQPPGEVTSSVAGNTVDTVGNTGTTDVNNNTDTGGTDTGVGTGGTGTGGTDTGSVNPELLAQASIPARYYRYPPHYAPVVVSVLGKNSTDTVEFDVSTPPEDVTPCVQGVRVHSPIPVLEEAHQYNSWWILASATDTLQTRKNSIYFYWARQISDSELGLVPILTPIDLNSPKEVQLDLGYVKLPYQWVSRIESFGPIPVNPEVSCEN